MKFLLLLSVCMCINLSYAQITMKDEGLHFATGAAISAGTYALVYSKTKNKKKAFWWSFGLSSLAGLSKEVFDGYIIDGKFDTGEFLATAAGGLVASYSFDIFTGKKNKKKQHQNERESLQDDGLSYHNSSAKY